MKSKIWLTCLALLLLCSCATSPEERARQQAEARRAESARVEAERRFEAQRRVKIDNQCRSYGFSPGTTPFSECVMKIDVAEREVTKQRTIAAVQQEQRVSQCKMVEAQAWLTPGLNFADGAAKASSAFQNCMAGLPPPPNINLTCMKVGANQVECNQR